MIVFWFRQLMTALFPQIVNRPFSTGRKPSAEASRSFSVSYLTLTLIARLSTRCAIYLLWSTLKADILLLLFSSAVCQPCPVNPQWWMMIASDSLSSPPLNYPRARAKDPQYYKYMWKKKTRLQKILDRQNFWGKQLFFVVVCFNCLFFLVQLNSDRGITDLSMDSPASFAGTSRNRPNGYHLAISRPCSALWTTRWPGPCGTFLSASPIGSFSVKKNCTSTSESTMSARKPPSLSISYSTLTSRSLMFAGVKSLGCRGALSSTRWLLLFFLTHVPHSSFTTIKQTRDGAMYQEVRDVVTVNEYTDRVYQNTPQEHIITNVVSNRKMRIQKYNFPDTGERWN